MSYLSALNIEQEPFSTSPDPAFFYSSAGHIAALNKLEIALRLRRGLSVVLGDVGTGKTTLCRKLIRSFDSEEFVFHVMFDPFVGNEGDFYVHLARLFGLTPTSSSIIDHSDAIQHYLLQQCAEEEKTPVLIIDEGQKLKNEHLEILRTLLNYETNERKLLQLVIFGQMELLPRLQSLPNFSDRVSLKFILKPFSLAETREMIEFRLARAGHPLASTLFTPEAVEIIYEYTKGYPRQITKICHNSMELLLMGGLCSVTADVAREAVRQDRTWNCDE